MFHMEKKGVNMQSLEHGQYCRIINTTIFGTYMGKVDGHPYKVYFYDKELNTIKLVSIKQLEPVIDY
mgnify:CR=1 FL=1